MLQIIALYAAHDRGPTSFSKLGIGVEEMDEAVFWLEMLSDAAIVPVQRLTDLNNEAGELFAIFTASQLTAKGIHTEALIHTEAQEFVNL